MGVAERRAREKEELRERILRAATELFVQEGFASVSIRKIAERIEYSPTTIYLHFKDKAELIGSICSEVFGELAVALNEIGSAGLAPLAKLRESLVRYVEFGRAHPDHYVVVFCLPEPVELTAVLHDGSRKDPGMECFDKLRAGVALCMADGSIREGDVETVSQTIFVLIHGVTAALITMKSFPWIEKERLIRGSVDTILRGLGAKD
jgi:AcrR family transcriptional regulator